MLFTKLKHVFIFHYSTKAGKWTEIPTSVRYKFTSERNISCTDPVLWILLCQNDKVVTTYCIIIDLMANWEFLWPIHTDSSCVVIMSPQFLLGLIHMSMWDWDDLKGDSKQLATGESNSTPSHYHQCAHQHRHHHALAALPQCHTAPHTTILANIPHTNMHCTALLSSSSSSLIAAFDKVAG